MAIYRVKITKEVVCRDYNHALRLFQGLPDDEGEVTEFFAFNDGVLMENEVLARDISRKNSKILAAFKTAEAIARINKPLDF
jgi:hypothetical protein